MFTWLSCFVSEAGALPLNKAIAIKVKPATVKKIANRFMTNLPSSEPQVCQPEPGAAVTANTERPNTSDKRPRNPVINNILR
jgi:hypothetical protein